ncbi:putative Fructokinase [Oceanicola granulosus HTCC2516]|uniref:Putative Fructokinase n=1 Tax=Oceanicola granulosus (strain ATCC BAA-861 / DSM 15982 / KCTC 12143 / HTCC2516) TaxID=314256 RepID=Q2CAY2_OCEGH|nr:carbohydrate kinase [Oceanicola granulosus]EAR49843.1 putative Fructokinase [Oceanicola granulosus HTCC2516]
MILACGEALIDMLPRTTESGEDTYLPAPGGAVFNTAVALGRLGAPASFFSGLSSDFFGDMLRASLAESGVDTTLAPVSDRPTTLAFVKLVNGQASYLFYDENTAGRMLEEDDLPETDARALFFGGISLMVEPCGSAYEALMRRAAPDCVTMIDPNIRPQFIRNESAYRARIGRMIAAADIVKVSDDDLRWLEGDGEIACLARRMLEQGPKLVLVTRGGDGVTGYTRAHTIDQPAVPTQVVDTVGAGDTFNAGILASLHARGALTKYRMETLDEETLAAALALGARAAAVTVSRAGANPPWASEL